MGHPAQEGEAKLQGVLECVLKGLPYVDFIELNESCPNVGGHSSDGLASRIHAVLELRDDASRYVPVLIKLGTFGEVRETVKLMTQLGVDGLVVLRSHERA